MDVVKLSVYPEQKDFVATNTESILEAYAYNAQGDAALPFAIYRNDILIGFVMFGYGDDGEEDEPDIAAGNYCIVRFMIDQKYQGKGYGKEALSYVLEYLRTMPVGPAEYCWLSYEPENKGGKHLYESMGFRENGEMCGEEVVAILKL